MNIEFYNERIVGFCEAGNRILSLVLLNYVNVSRRALDGFALCYPELARVTVSVPLTRPTWVNYDVKNYIGISA
jgi:hypothetical protein